jgi:hypothetical protein
LDAARLADAGLREADAETLAAAVVYFSCAPFRKKRLPATGTDEGSVNEKCSVVVPFGINTALENSTLHSGNVCATAVWPAAKATIRMIMK